MDERELTFFAKVKGFLFCSVLFGGVYHFSAEYAKTLANVPSFIFPFEVNMPFVEWMIIPYMTSIFFFGLMFFWTKNYSEFVLLVKRVSFVIVVAGIFYFVFPLKFSFEKPEIQSSIFQLFFSFLVKYDSPFNQSPSLHIAFAVLEWSVVRSRFRGTLLYLIVFWLLLLGLSTLLVYQHHFIDVISGVGVAFLSFIFIKNSKY